jgi:hypothetical protein
MEGLPHGFMQMSALEGCRAAMRLMWDFLARNVLALRMPRRNGLPRSAKAVPAGIGAGLTHSLVSPAGLTTQVGFIRLAH